MFRPASSALEWREVPGVTWTHRCTLLAPWTTDQSVFTGSVRHPPVGAGASRACARSSASCSHPSQRSFAILNAFVSEGSAGSCLLRSSTTALSNNTVSHAPFCARYVGFGGLSAANGPNLRRRPFRISALLMAYGVFGSRPLAAPHRRVHSRTITGQWLRSILVVRCSIRQAGPGHRWEWGNLQSDKMRLACVRLNAGSGRRLCDSTSHRRALGTAPRCQRNVRPAPGRGRSASARTRLRALADSGSCLAVSSFAY